jgi:hypothetical protein
LRVNLEIQRRAVVIAIRRVDQTRETLNTPPPPPQPGQPTTSLGPTAALNLLTALNDLLSSQNNFMSVWLNYYATRMRLARELGTMQLDERGVWLEVPFEDAERLRAEEVELPPDVPEALLKALNENLPKSQSPPATEPPPLPAPRDPAARPNDAPLPGSKPAPAPLPPDVRKPAAGASRKTSQWPPKAVLAHAPRPVDTP